MITAEWRTGRLGVGDWIELRSSMGDRHRAKIKSIEMVRFTGSRVEYKVDAHNPGGLLLAGIDHAHVTRGDEVWSVVDPLLGEFPVKEHKRVRMQAGGMKQQKRWWHLPWWEWLILAGSSSVIISLYWMLATTQVRMLQSYERAAERRHVQPHRPD